MIMPQHQHQHQGQARSDFDTARNVMFVVVTAWAMALRVPLRKACGKNHIGAFYFIVPFFIFLFAGFTNTEPLMYWIPVFFAGCAFNAMTAARIKKRGYHVHTYSWGDPWLGRMVVLGCRKPGFAEFGESLLVVVIGLFAMELLHNDYVFNFFLYGAGAMLVAQALSRSAIERSVDTRRDAILDSEAYVRALRQRR